MRFRTTPPVEIDLATQVSAAARRSLATVGLDGTFGLATPCNPMGRRTDDTTNGNRLIRFLAELDAAGKRYVRVDGCSPDGSHVEPGVALAWPQGDVVALARKWEQSAIYWWDGATFWVIGALTQSAPWQLGGAA
ncbi:MAG TPA: DUF3293 domain-containing protein [Gemmatimonadales bacterium]